MPDSRFGKLFATTYTKANAEKDARILKNHDYKPRIIKGKGLRTVNGRVVRTDIYWVYGRK